MPMFMKRSILFLLILFLHGIVMGNGFSSLKIGAEARSTGLGMAGTTLLDGASGGFWNPASFADRRGAGVMFSLHRWVEDIRSQVLGFGWSNGGTGFGIYLLYTDVGEIEHRLEPSPTPLGTFTSHELVFGLSYGTTLWQGLRVGLTVKGLYEKIYVSEAWGVAGDLGVLWLAWEERIRIGGVIQNIGKTSKLEDEPVDLPLVGRLGVGVPFRVLGGDWIAVVDGVKERGFPWHMHAGIEFGYRKMLFLRVGYQSGYDIKDMTCGLGFSWKNIRLDYGYQPIGGGLGDAHRLSFRIGW